MSPPQAKEELPELTKDQGILEAVTDEPKKVIRKKSIRLNGKFVAIVLTTVLVLVAAFLAVLYFQKNRTATESLVPEEKKEVVADVEAPEATKTAYIISEVGLNLREEPVVTSNVLAIIPFGTKFEILEEKDGWYKTEFDNKTGWISKEFTSTEDPLVYQNKELGFQFTFLPSWAGYSFVEVKNSESTTVKTFYVTLPTKDTAWNESASGVSKGMGSLFAMGVYTKAEWAKIEEEEMKPAKLGESAQYVYTYLPGQAYPADLKAQYAQIKTIIESFKVLN